MKNVLIAVGLVVLVGSVAQAQTKIVIGPNSKLTWTDPATDPVTAASLAVVPNVDGTNVAVLTGITCVADATTPADSDCEAPLATNTQVPSGSHTITLTNQSGTVTSLPSSPYAYNDITIPTAKGVKIIGS